MFALCIAGHIARLTIDRAGARNAVSHAGWRELAAVAGALGDARVLILASGDPAAFSAGADIGELLPLAEDAAARPVFRTRMRAGLAALAELPIPTIAVVDGACYGAGVALALACDVRIAGPAARFAITPAKMGIGYPLEDVARLVDLVGTGQASRLLFSAAPIDGAEAARIGLAEIFAEDAAATAERLAATIAANSAESNRLLKATIAAAGRGQRGSAAFDDAFDARFGSDDFRAGTAAFRAGRGR